MSLPVCQMRLAVRRHAMRTAMEALTGSDGPAASWTGATILPFIQRYSLDAPLTCPGLRPSLTITLAPGLCSDLYLRLTTIAPILY